MLKEFLSDLHIHTCLSPCTEIEMLPGAIIKRAKDLKLHSIGVTDHNSAENALAMKKAGQRSGLNVITGMEITSKEEAHILAFFEEDNALLEMQKLIYKNLPGENDAEKFGSQIVVDDEDNPTGFSEKLLIGATTLTVEEVVSAIHELNGLAIASHIDREAFSILGQLGFIPRELKLDALEVSRAGFADMPSGFSMVTFSDAHYLADIGKNATKFLVEEMTVSEMKKALEGKDGRSVTAHFGYS